MKLHQIITLGVVAIISIAIGFFLGGGLGEGSIVEKAKSLTEKEAPKVEYSHEAKVGLLNTSYEQLFNFIKVPSKIDPLTTLDKVEKDEENIELVYYYTISGIDAEELRKNQAVIREQTFATVCNVPSSKALLDAGIGMRWKYFTEDKEHIFDNELITGCE